MNVDFFQNKFFWYSFVLIAMLSLFFYGQSLDYTENEFQKAKRQLKLAKQDISSLNDSINFINDKVKRLNIESQIKTKEILEYKSKNLSYKNEITSLNNEILNLNKKIIYLENLPPKIEIKYKTIYKEKKIHYKYGKGKGKITIYKTCSNCPNFRVWVDNQFKGTINSSYEKYNPNCNNSYGTISFIITAGYHIIKCEDEYGSIWNKNITLKENECYLQGFSKSR